MLLLLQSKAISRDVLDTVGLQALQLTVGVMLIVISAVARTGSDCVCSLFDSAFDKVRC